MPTTRFTVGPNVGREPEKRLEPCSTLTTTRPIPIVVSSEAARKSESSVTGLGLARATTTTPISAGQTIEATASTKISTSGTDGRRLEHAREPSVDPAGDLLPVRSGHVQVRPAVELEVVGLRRRLLVSLELRLRNRRRNRLVLPRSDDQQRGALLVLEVHLGRRVQVEVREPCLVEDLPGLGNRVALVRGGSVLRRERVHEGVRELVEGQRHDPMPPRRVGKRRRSGLQRRERQHEDALRRRRAERNTRAPEAAVEQQLDEEAAVGVADQDRRLVEPPDELLVVIDDLGHAEALDRVCLLAELLDIGGLPGPLGHGDVEALLEVAGVVLPAPGREPGAVDQHQRGAAVAGHLPSPIRPRLPPATLPEWIHRPVERKERR